MERGAEGVVARPRLDLGFHPRSHLFPTLPVLALISEFHYPV